MPKPCYQNGRGKSTRKFAASGKCGRGVLLRAILLHACNILLFGLPERVGTTRSVAFAPFLRLSKREANASAICTDKPSCVSRSRRVPDHGPTFN